MSQPTAAAAGASPPATRTPAQIETEIEATRVSLAGSIDLLQNRLSPASLAQAVRDKAVGVFKREDGSLDPVRTAAVAGVTVVLFLYMLRRRRL